jgi:hypothetical protein
MRCHINGRSCVISYISQHVFAMVKTNMIKYDNNGEASMFSRLLLLCFYLSFTIYFVGP